MNAGAEIIIFSPKDKPVRVPRPSDGCAWNRRGVFLAIRIALRACAILVSLLTAAAPGASGKELATEHFTIDYTQIPDATANAVARDAEQAFRDVTSFLDVDWQGGKIKIIVSPEYVEPYMSRAELTVGIPPNRLGPRGAITGPPPVQGRAMPFWNALVHVLAPGTVEPADWQNFVTEGCGIYLQSLFGGHDPTPWPAKYYPTMGEPLDAAAAAQVAQYGALSAAEAVRLLNDRRFTATRRLAWLEAGSFIRYLVDTRGRSAFLRWYRGESFEDSYGSTPDALISEWTDFIKRLKPS